MIRYLKLYFSFVKHNINRELQYRPDFFFTLFGRITWFALSIFFFSAIYGHTTEINGWTLYQALFLVGVFDLIETVMFTLFWMNFSRMPAYINEGELDFILIKPVDAQFFTSFYYFSLSFALSIISPIILIIVSMAKLGLQIDLWQILIFIVALLLSMAVFYSLWFLTVISLFWLNKIYDIQELFVHVFAFMRYPTSIYEGAVRGVFTFVIPVIFTVIVPVQIMFRALDAKNLLALFLIAGISFTITRVVWKLGIKHYSSASS